MKRIIDIVSHPRAAVVVHDLGMVLLAWYAAGWLTERTAVTTASTDASILSSFLVVLLLQGGVLWATGLYKGLWRFASFQDMWNIARACVFGTVAIMAAMALARGLTINQWIPTILVYPALLFVLLGLPRMCFRFWKDSRISVSASEEGLKRVLILGAGRSGAMLETAPISRPPALPPRAKRRSGEV